MNKIIFLACNNIGTGQSGGDTIFLNLAKYWQNKLQITIFGSQETKGLLKRSQLTNINFIKIDNNNRNTNLTVKNLLLHQIRRSFLSIKAVIAHKSLIKSSHYIYSASDFFPDLLPALISKMINPNIVWIAPFYLKAPNPFSPQSPYNQTGQFFKGLIYYFFQIPSLVLIKLFSQIVYVTSAPDQKLFPGKKVIVIRGGVDESYLKKVTNIPVSKRKYHAVFMGRLHPQKGVLELLDIWKLVCQKIPTAKLAIIGDGQLDRQLSIKINKLGLNKNIDILGFLTGPAKYNVFINSKIVVHPAIYDSGGMAAAEAMGLGIPGVCYDLESLKTYYPKGMIKTDCFDQLQFSQNIIKLLTTPKLYRQYSLDVKHLISQHWLWSAQALKIYQLTFSSLLK